MTYTKYVWKDSFLDSTLTCSTYIHKSSNILHDYAYYQTTPIHEMTVTKNKNMSSICNPWMGVHPYKFHFNYIFTHPNTCTCLLLHDIITCLCLHMYIFYCVSVILVTCIPTPDSCSLWKITKVDFQKQYIPTVTSIILSILYTYL